MYIRGPRLRPAGGAVESPTAGSRRLWNRLGGSGEVRRAGSTITTGPRYPSPAAWRRPAHREPRPSPPSVHAKGNWLTGYDHEYWRSPESWFVGRMVKARGLPACTGSTGCTPHRGVSMEGTDRLDGRQYHIQGSARGWVTRWRLHLTGRRLVGRRSVLAARAGTGVPRQGGDLPLTPAAGPTGRVPRTSRCAMSPSRRVPRCRCTTTSRSRSTRALIPLGSRVYVPPTARTDMAAGYCQDTGGAITGHHIDVYRTPPASPLDTGGLPSQAQRDLRDQPTP